MGQEQLCSAQRVIHAFIILRAEQRDNRGVAVALVIDANRDLWQEGRSVDGVTGKPQLCAQHVLCEIVALAQTKRGADIARVEALMRVTQFETVKHTNRATNAAISVVRQFHRGELRRCAHAAIHFKAGDRGPLGKATA